ncbi:MAG TPA: DUF5069 domain-containing protein, partial [Opitutaceae bacterium]
FPQQFRALYDKAVGLYAKGQRGADTYFTPDELAWLAANGINAQHIYDYAEDHNGYGGEPGFEHALSIEIVRRDYFLNVQKGKPSTTVLDQASLPAKSDAVRGIEWLPRLLPKARAKLRGELPPTLMYGCGGDRKFLKERNILPAEFLAVLWRNETNEAAVVDWVAARSGK